MSYNKAFSTDDFDTQVEVFTHYFMKCLNECAALVTRERKRPPASWINEHQRELMRKRNNTQIRLNTDIT